MWERACSRMLTDIQHRCCLTHRFREQARSHNVFHRFRYFLRARHEAQHANQTRQPPWLLRWRGPGDRNRQPCPGSLRAADLRAS
ncbi:hypothetical protein PkoCFBP13504_02950 [Pseudomonas koreensis]|nr:hypothetical protein PkoCFBP13504_02950 [Pseudomonas koreensis]